MCQHDATVVPIRKAERRKAGSQQSALQEPEHLFFRGREARISR